LALVVLAQQSTRAAVGAANLDLTFLQRSVAAAELISSQEDFLVLAAQLVAQVM
jgi:hypothetical protein